MTEREMLELLHRRYGVRSHNGGVYAPRYICAEHVRAGAGFEQRTADFIAVDTWESSMRQGWLTVHGVEVKVSRSDWLRELKDPRKAAEGMRYASHRWLAVPDPAIVREGELPDGWGLLCYAQSRGLIAKVAAADYGGEPLSPSAIAALLRAATKTAVARAADNIPPGEPDAAEHDDGTLFDLEASLWIPRSSVPSRRADGAASPSAPTSTRPAPTWATWTCSPRSVVPAPGSSPRTLPSSTRSISPSWITGSRAVSPAGPSASDRRCALAACTADIARRTARYD